MALFLFPFYYEKNFSYSLRLVLQQFASSDYRFDALRYSTDNTQGTARFAALSGAFGALGAICLP